MSRVTYQVAFPRGDDATPTFTALDPDAIGTRTRDAKVRISVDVSKRQARWLAAAPVAGGDPGALVRALVDLAMELDIDWTAVTKPAQVRDAVRGGVLIRRRDA